MNRAALLATALPALFAPLGPSAAQDYWWPSRTAHVFLSRRLEVEIRADAPGVLRIAPGPAGQIVVTGRALGGLTPAGLTGRSDDRLVLTALGADSVEFIVLVPRAVRTIVRLPGGGFPEVTTSDAGGTYAWRARDAPRDPGDRQVRTDRETSSTGR
jgi:hypothetical protein